MRHRIGLERVEATLARLRDDARIHVDAVAADALVLEQLQEDATPAAEVDYLLLAHEQVDELLGLRADDLLVATEARLEIHGVQVRRDLVLAPLLPLALEPGEALTEARREAALDVV